MIGFTIKLLGGPYAVSCIYTRICKYIFILIYIPMYIPIYIPIYILIYILVYIPICRHLHVCIYILYTYIHTPETAIHLLRSLPYPCFIRPSPRNPSSSEEKHPIQLPLPRTNLVEKMLFSPQKIVVLQSIISFQVETRCWFHRVLYKYLP